MSEPSLCGSWSQHCLRHLKGTNLCVTVPTCPLVQALNFVPQESIRSALIGRVHDSNVEVLEALYEFPETFAKAVLASPSEYIEALASSIAAPGSKPKRTALRLHLGFLITHLLSSLDSKHQADVFDRLLFPFLLFSKPRQHTAELVWEAVDQVLQTSPQAVELLKGCPELAKKDGERTHESMVSANAAVTSKFADNILRSDHFAQHLETLVSKLHDENPHSRAFAYLVMRALVEKMSGAHQIEVANKVLEALNLEELPSLDDLPESQSVDEAVQNEVIGKAVVSKPSSKTTLAWLQVGVLVAIAQVPQPANKEIDWFKATDPMSRDTGDLYVSTTRKVYRILNNSGSVPSLAFGLLQGLFGSLKTDVLAFLAGIWTSSNPEFQPLQALALLQATAFLEAHVQEADGIDFQTILPALLVALQASNTQSRLAALECLKRLRIISQGKLTQVYKFDVIYGSNSGAYPSAQCYWPLTWSSIDNLQYLDQGDLQRYLEALLAHADHFENDGAYLPVFHGHYLVKVAGDKKKDSEYVPHAACSSLPSLTLSPRYKKRVLCYLLSHVNALVSQSMQIALLQSVGSVTDKAKLQLLLPTVQKLLLPNQEQREDLLLELLRSFNESAARELNDTNKPFWKVYTDLLRHYLKPDTSAASRDALADALEKGLYKKLDASRQVELCQLLLDLCTEDASLQRYCKQLLTNILNEVPVIVALLDLYSPSSNVGGERATKRAKTTEIVQGYSIRQLSFLAEILGTKTLPGSIELISHVLQVLNSIVQSLSPTEAEVNYTEQLLMSAVETAANGVSVRLSLFFLIRSEAHAEASMISGHPQPGAFCHPRGCSRRVDQGDGEPGDVPPGSVVDVEPDTPCARICAAQCHAGVHVHGLQRLPS